ncbi:RdRP-domain-containing protein [Trichocladium antarcticum]|uniref:RNA-dependent RNA polymerase n=1 Tax=Trichocladium antarcticum TaxID=1450529 RepID=A0AAN6UBT2_9PEZI|nr:RdRP-domain-containing protein [Trichocladium antarcticum]
MVPRSPTSLPGLFPDGVQTTVLPPQDTPELRPRLGANGTDWRGGGRTSFYRGHLRQGENTLTTPTGNTCPASSVIPVTKLSFGVLTQPTTFMEKKEVRPLGEELGLKFTADFKRRLLNIHFPLMVGQGLQYHRVDIKFTIIKKIYRINTGREGSTLVITVDDAPLVWKKAENVSGERWADRRFWGEYQLWHRAVEIRPQSENPRTGPVSIDMAYGDVDLGRWTTYWMDLDKAGEERWTAIEMHLHDWNIRTTLDVQFMQVPGKDIELWGMLADQVPTTSTETSLTSWNNGLAAALLDSTAQISLPFDVRYQLEVCLSRGILCEYNIKREFLEELQEMSSRDTKDPNRARLILEYAADQGTTIYNPMDLLKDRAALTYYPTALHIPPYCALVRKVTITPTRIYFSTPTVETTNRVVRHYRQVQDHFLRVQFTDELLDGRIRACETDRDDELYTRIYRVLIQGIRMGTWHWKFLAFGNSQIRENGAFFFCQQGDGSPVSCDTIRQWMGNFTHISSIAKLAARLGQCFSTTRLLRHILAPRIVKIDDMEKDGFCFTDGVGKISGVLAHFVSDDWNLYPAPSAFQFRMGGCKGILVAWPEVKGIEVHIRPSQEKFSAEYNGLEIIRCSQFSCATLNRQTILVLSCLGVPDDVFIDMMKKQLDDYNTAMNDKNMALELLNAYVDENMTTTTIATMIRNGFMHSREPFVRTVFQLWRSWSIKALKEKARLIVDQGAFVLGCVDETGTLRGHSKATEGWSPISQDQLPQIFLQVPDPRDRRTYKVITGLCIVGRNPSLHPGDIRVVEAVDIPQLQHIRDVVVFPLKGDRDVPSMLSGGDLDGDDFFVIWDPKLLPTEWGHPPMNYTAPKALVEKTTSITKSLASFFVLFMKNDRLPLIAHAHLATADSEIDGAKHPKCLQLAQLHSTAVDYVKSGIPAQWNKNLDPRKYPHFMEKLRAKSYHSTSVLGKLYDMIDKEVFDNRENYKLPFDKRILERFQLDNELLKEARKIKSQYDIGMRRIMGQLEIRTEFEIWSSFVLSRPRVGSDYKIQEKVGRESAGLKKQFRDLCITAAGDRAFDKLGPFVAAMYRVTWEETRIALYEARQPHVLSNGTVGLRKVTSRSMPLISFPWLFADELGKIATGSERLGGLGDLGPDRSWTEPKPREVLETARDILAMDYTRTSDGRCIHRGEILQLFRHDGEGSDDGGTYYNDGVISSDQDLLTPDNATSPTEQDSPVSLGLEETVADDGTDDLSNLVGMSFSRETSPIYSQLPATATRTTFDLLSSDVEDGNIASSACPTMAPTYLTTAEITSALAVRPRHGSADELVTSRAGGGSVVLDSMRSWETVAGIYGRTVTPTPAVGKEEEEEEEEDVEYEELEFTEAVVEVEEETVLERAARLG